MLRGHDDHVITCVEFCGDKIVSGSDDNTLKVWSATTYEVSLSVMFQGISRFCALVKQKKLTLLRLCVYNIVIAICNKDLK